MSQPKLDSPRRDAVLMVERREAAAKFMQLKFSAYWRCEARLLLVYPDIKTLATVQPCPFSDIFQHAEQVPIGTSQLIGEEIDGVLVRLSPTLQCVDQRVR